MRLLRRARPGPGSGRCAGGLAAGVTSKREGEEEGEGGQGGKQARAKKLQKVAAAPAFLLLLLLLSMIRLAPQHPGEGFLGRRPLLGPKVRRRARRRPFPPLPSPARLTRARNRSLEGRKREQQQQQRPPRASLRRVVAGRSRRGPALGRPAGRSARRSLPGALLAAARNSNDRDFSAGAATTTTTTRGGSRSRCSAAPTSSSAGSTAPGPLPRLCGPSPRPPSGERWRRCCGWTRRKADGGGALALVGSSRPRLVAFASVVVFLSGDRRRRPRAPPLRPLPLRPEGGSAGPWTPQAWS